MEISVLMIIAVCILQSNQVIAKSNPVVVTNDGKMRYAQKLNSVSTTAKPETHYQYQQEKYTNHYVPNAAAYPQQLILQPYPRTVVQQVGVPVQNQLHPQSQQQIIQLIQRVLYNAQQSNQPTAMIIIAQPAFVAPSVPYGSASQQLLNYFHNNPQARYQFVHGTPHSQQQPITQYVSPQPQQEVQQPVAPYPVLPAAPQYQAKMVPVPVPVPQTTHLSPVQAPPTASAHLQQIAQLAAQQYYHDYQQPQYQIEPENKQTEAGYSNTLPPIIAGLENFSPEHQEKIKAQLSAHFGAPLQPLNIGHGKQSEDAGKYQSLNTNEFMNIGEAKTGSNVMSVTKSKM